MSSLVKRYIPFLHSHDYFFVIELFGETLRGSLVAVDPIAKHIRIQQTAERRITAQPLEQFTEVLPAFIKKFRLPATVRVLALLDYRRATMLVGAVSLMRSDPKAELKQAELKNLVSQGVWKLANSQRAAAAIKMNIPEVRAQLADADVVQVRLNGHRVVNPVGFTARSIELYCRETFVDELLLGRLTKALTDDNLAVIVEAPAVLAGLIARLHPQQDFLFVSVGADESVLYRAHQMTISYIDSVFWGTETLLSGVAKEFSVSVEAANQMLTRYARHEVSHSMSLALERSASGELAMLSNAIASHQPREASVPVYVHAATHLPEFLFDPAFSRRLGLELSLTSVNDHFIGKHTGFVVQWQQQHHQGSRYTFDALVAAISDVYVVSSSSVMTTAAKQRARWIQSAHT